MFLQRTNILTLLFLISVSAFGQAPGAASTAAAMQSVFNAYWSSAPGVRSLAQLHNNLITAPLSVQPVLFMTDGSSLNLSPVVLPPLGNATIDIVAELSASALTQPLSGSVAFQYQRKHPGALNAEVYVENARASLSYTIPSTEKPPSSATQHAVFWLPSPTAEVYAALQNTSGAPINVSPSLVVGGRAIPLQQVHLPPHGSSFLDIFSASGLPGTMWQKGSVGGITLVHDGPPGSLNTGGWIEDDPSGFSTTMTFADPSVGRNALLGTQILVGAAGGHLKLQSPMQVSSQLVVRNTSSSPISFNGELVFSGNEGTVMPVPIQQLGLAAGQVVGIDLGQLKANAAIPASLVSASIALRWEGAGSGLMARVYGASEDGSYGFYWALQPYGGASYTESFWTTEGSWTPILTVANFAAIPDNITVEITSNAGVYVLPPFALQPSQSYTINIRDLIASGVPGKTGELFPRGATSGGYRIYGASQRSNLVIKEHLIDPVGKLATPFYGNYVYALDARFENPITLVYVGGSNQPIGTIIDNSDSSTSNGCPPGFNFIPDGSGGEVIYGGMVGCVGYITGASAGTMDVTASQVLMIDAQGDTGDVEADGEVEIQDFNPGTPPRGHFQIARSGPLHSQDPISTAIREVPVPDGRLARVGNE